MSKLYSLLATIACICALVAIYAAYRSAESYMDCLSDPQTVVCSYPLVHEPVVK